MTPARIMIVDDEQPARARMRELLGDCAGEFPHVVAGEAANGIEGLELVGRSPADLALVDIHMPGMSGIEFARHLQVLEHPPAVIFVTAHDQYAVQAFEVNAVDYLLKPVRAARLLAALKKASGTARLDREVLDRIDPNPRRYFSVAERGRVTLVPVADVVFLKAELKYVTIRTRDAEFLIEDSLPRSRRNLPGFSSASIATAWYRGPGSGVSSAVRTRKATPAGRSASRIAASGCRSAGASGRS
jgi:two-component system, LytTR family, response regulator AlgR